MNSVVKSLSKDIPTVSIQGALRQQLRVDSGFTMTGLGVPSPCSDSQVLDYSWVVTGRSDISSEDLDPSRFSLSGYAFSDTDIKKSFAVEVTVSTRTTGRTDNFLNIFPLLPANLSII